MRGDSVEVSAAVSNAGPHWGRATVILKELPGDDAMYTQEVSLDPGESRELVFSWETPGYALGDHRLRAAVEAHNDSNPDNDVSETAVATILDDREITVGYGEANAGSQMQQHLAEPSVPPLPRISIGETSIHPEAPVAGEPVSITVSVLNTGGRSGSAPITLHFPSDAKRAESRRPRVGAGETGTASFTWRTGRYPPGTYSFRVESLNAHETFSVDLLPPTVDFVLAAIYPPSTNYPIVKGDWVEVAAFVRNIGKYEGKATVKLRDLTEQRVMYDQNVSMEPGESRIVEFTWKTLRYDVGEHRVKVEADARYDVDTSNNYSEPAQVEILTGRDITLGFVGDNPEEAMVVETSKPRINVAGKYPADVIVLNDAPSAIQRWQMVQPHETLGVVLLPRSDLSATVPSVINSDGRRMSPLPCAQQPRTARAVQHQSALCPGVWALIR